VPLFCTLNHRAHRRNGRVAAHLPGFGFCAALSSAARCSGPHSKATRLLPAQRAALLLEVLLVVEAVARGDTDARGGLWPRGTRAEACGPAEFAAVLAALVALLRPRFESLGRPGLAAGLAAVLRAEAPDGAALQQARELLVEAEVQSFIWLLLHRHAARLCWWCGEHRVSDPDHEGRWRCARRCQAERDRRIGGDRLGLR
jgi:hypothetical protein